MGYYNPILAYGEERYPGDILEAGGDGLIVPDLPPEEAGPLRNEAKRVNLAYINFLAPSSSDARVKLVLNSAAGFVYMVSVTGVTGARRRFSDNLVDFVAKIKSMTELPIAVGFGISSPDQAAMIGDIADGVIVGSALIDAVDAADDKPAAAAAFVSDLQRAVKR
jgi:tryptophan synthase alpha chain